MSPQFQELLLAEIPQLRGYAMKLVRNTAAADDLLQQTALHAWRSQGQFSLGTNFRAWIHRILRNEFLSSCRRARFAHLPIEDTSDNIYSYPGDQEDKVMVGEVRAAMQQLPRSQREALYLKCENHYTYNETAAALQCSVGTVKSRLWRARQALQVAVAR